MLEINNWFFCKANKNRESKKALEVNYEHLYIIRLLYRTIEEAPAIKSSYLEMCSKEKFQQPVNTYVDSYTLS